VFFTLRSRINPADRLFYVFVPGLGYLLVVVSAVTLFAHHHHAFADAGVTVDAQRRAADYGTQPAGKDAWLTLTFRRAVGGVSLALARIEQ
jgi:hypothetical protein